MVVTTQPGGAQQITNAAVGSGLHEALVERVHVLNLGGHLAASLKSLRLGRVRNPHLRMLSLERVAGTPTEADIAMLVALPVISAVMAFGEREELAVPALARTLGAPRVASLFREPLMCFVARRSIIKA